MKYYAIGMKTWAEIREASKQPSPVPSSIEREAEIEDIRYVPDSLGRMMPRKTKRKTTFTLSQTAYVGGKILGVLPINVLRYAGFPAPGDGGIIELPKGALKLLKAQP